MKSETTIPVALVCVQLLCLSAFALPDAVKWWVGKSDQQIWEWIPDLKIHGMAHGTWGCPVCGKKIFDHRGHYPWIWHPDRPYKVKCPICKRVFPSNDYHKWMLGGRREKLDTTQKYVDDGNGYVGPDGVRYVFIEYAMGECYKMCIWKWALHSGAPRLAAKYAKTGDEAFANKCAVILAKVATQYPRLNADRPDNLTLDQIKKLPYVKPSQGRLATIAGYQREAGTLSLILEAYRKIYTYLEKGGDPELKRFLAGKSINDVRSLIEWDLCHELILGALEGNFVSGNGATGLHASLAQAALAWDMHDPARGATTGYLLDWILHAGPICVDEWMQNGFDRDGFNATPSFGYQFGGGVMQVAPLAQILKTAGVDLYRYPRIREIIRAPIKPVVAGKWYPTMGDAGHWKGFEAGRYWRSEWMGPLLAASGDPLIAKALANSPRGQGQYGKKVAEVINRVGKEIEWTSRNFSTLGLAIVESGSGDFRRGLSCYYGGTTAHGRFDRLNFNLFNSRGPLTPGLGYPHMSSPERHEWTANTASHNTVVVDARKQVNREPGHLNTLRVTPTVQAVEIDGNVAYRGIVSQYKRSLVFVDVDEKNSYLIDIFRVAGGSQHDYSLHGGSGNVTIEGIELDAQKGGTLAGPDVKFRERYDCDAGNYRGSGYQYLFSVEKGCCEKAGFVVTWDHWKGKTPFLRVHVPRGTAEQALFASGLPPFGSTDDALRYMFLRNGSCPPRNQQHKNGKRVFAAGDLQSTFVTVLELLYDAPFITSVERVSGVKGMRNTDVALSITRDDGTTDLLVCLETPSEVRVREMTLQGRIGLCTVGADGRTLRLALLDGNSLSIGESSATVTGSNNGIVTSVDYESMTLTVPEKLLPADQVVGKTIIFSIPPRTTTFVIDSVQPVPEGSLVHLRDVDAIILRSKVEKVDNRCNAVILNSPISILNAGRGMAGMRLWNEDRSVNVRIRSFDTRWDPNSPWPPFGGTAYVEGGHDLETAFRDLDGDGRVLAYVCEFGPGDRYSIGRTAYLEQR